jgi:hypothetical protein
MNSFGMRIPHASPATRAVLLLTSGLSADAAWSIHAADLQVTRVLRGDSRRLLAMVKREVFAPLTASDDSVACLGEECRGGAWMGSVSHFKGERGGMLKSGQIAPFILKTVRWRE